MDEHWLKPDCALILPSVPETQVEGSGEKTETDQFEKPKESTFYLLDILR